MIEGPSRHALAHALEFAWRAVTKPDLATRKRPLPGSSVHAVAEHLVQVVESFADEFGALPSSEPAPSDLGVRLGMATSRVLDVWDDESAQREEPPLSKHDRRWVLMCELVVHTWDLGYPSTALPQGVAAECRQAAEPWIDHFREQGTVGPARHTDSTLAVDQLAAFFGRQVP